MLLAVVMPPPQLKAGLLIVDEAVKTELKLEQVNTAGIAMFAEGANTF